MFQLKSSFLLSLLIISTTIILAQNKHDHNAHFDPNDPAHKKLKNKKERQLMNWMSTRPDGHAPITVMGDHTHHKGGIMFSYRLMNMSMEGNLFENDDINNIAIYEKYNVAPQSMQMQMHMLGMMYAVSHKLTLMLMSNVGVINSMDLKSKMNVDFNTRATGLGDMSLTGLYKIFNKNAQTLHLNLGISFPVGNINSKDDTPMGSNMKLPYPMQLGSGTYDGLIGATYLGQREKYSWGIQPMFTIRTGENSEGYRFGNNFNLSGWGAYQLNNWISTSVRLSFNSQGRIKGEDDELNPMMVTTADTNNIGGERINTSLGVNMMLPGNLRLGVEYNQPILQKLNGIQMKAQNSIVIGLQFALGH